MYKLKIGSELQDMLVALPIAEQTKLGNFLLANANEHIVQSFLNDNVSADERPNYLNQSVDDAGKLSWTTNKKIQLYSFDNDEQIYTDRRMRSKVGRTINKIFCSNFLERLGVDNHDMDNFVRQLKCYKAVSDDVDLDEDFYVTTNFDYYGECHTSYDARDGCGSLGESCMRHNNCVDDRFFEVYEDNNIKLLTHKNDDGDIDSRALIWTLDDGRILMDRIYTDFDHKEELFKRYASRHGYWYKKRQSYSDKTTFINKEGKEVNDEGIFFKLRYGRSYDNMPYLDTFSYSFKLKDDYYLTNHPKAAYEEFGVTDFFYYESVDGYYSNHSIEVGLTYNPDTDEITSGVLEEDYQVIFFEIDDEGNKTPNDIEESSKLRHVVDKSLDYIYNKSERMDVSRISEEKAFSISRDKLNIVRGTVLDGDRELELTRYFLREESFCCSYTGSTYYESHFEKEEVEGKIHRAQDVIDAYDGRRIHKGSARVVFFGGKARVTDHETKSVKTLDGVVRVQSECVYIETINNEGYWYSELVHSKEIAMAKKLNEFSRKYKNANAGQLPSVDELVSGKHDNRRTY